MRATIFAGGQAGLEETWRKRLEEEDLIVGADGGAALALTAGLVPDVVVGDMDSLSGENRATLEVQGCRFVEHPRAKDETDLELALTYAVEAGARKITILGALGGRLDHLVANLLLLTLPGLAGVTVRIVGGQEEALLVRGGDRAALVGKPGDLVSLLPLGGDARGVITEGLAWQLRGDTLCFGFSRGVSNEMTARTAKVTVEEGYLLVIHGPPAEGR